MPLVARKTFYSVKESFTIYTREGNKNVIYKENSAWKRIPWKYIFFDDIPLTLYVGELYYAEFIHRINRDDCACTEKKNEHENLDGIKFRNKTKNFIRHEEFQLGAVAHCQAIIKRILANELIDFYATKYIMCTHIFYSKFN